MDNILGSLLLAAQNAGANTGVVVNELVGDVGNFLGNIFLP
jgi:hypothetical protein